MTLRLGLSVRAESICQATSSAQTLYPGAQIRVIFPIEPECFFVIDSAATVGRSSSRRRRLQRGSDLLGEGNRVQIPGEKW